MSHNLRILAAQVPALNEPSLDRRFVQQIGESFGSGGAVTPALLAIAATVLVFCVLTVLAVRFWRRWRDSREEAAPPIGWLVDQASIMDVLENALLHRAKIEISFHQKDTRRRSVACALLEVSQQALLVELPAGIAPGPSWVGREVDGFFQISKGPSSHSRKIFYHFTSRVSATPKGGGHAARLALAIPEKMVLSQKRAFLRMAPPSSAVPVFELFPEDAASLQRCLDWLLPPAPPEGQEPQPPQPLPSLGRFNIKDISGGGARVEAKVTDRALVQQLAPAVGATCYVALELKADPPRRFVLVVVIRRVFRDNGGILDLGLEFSHSLRGRAEDTGAPVWRALKGKGEEDIESWVVRKYLEVYREKGVEPTA